MVRTDPDDDDALAAGIEALRSRDIKPWATTIACCYSAVMKLAYLSDKARVYRGVKEEKVHLQVIPHQIYFQLVELIFLHRQSTTKQLSILHLMHRAHLLQ